MILKERDLVGFKLILNQNKYHQALLILSFALWKSDKEIKRIDQVILLYMKM
jgi:hypothetical protein